MIEKPFEWELLSKKAWSVKENAYLIDKKNGTAVGAALIANNNEVFTGCNVEHKYRILDVHAEVNAITNMITAGQKSFYAILVVAERKRFTPCGSCLDWIIQFGSLQCRIGYQSERNGKIIDHSAHELMPFYPE